MPEAEVAAVRNYRARKKALMRLQERLRTERKNWHAPWARKVVPGDAVRELIDELCELAEVGE